MIASSFGGCTWVLHSGCFILGAPCSMVEPTEPCIFSEHMVSWYGNITSRYEWNWDMMGTTNLLDFRDNPDNLHNSPNLCCLELQTVDISWYIYIREAIAFSTNKNRVSTLLASHSVRAAHLVDGTILGQQSWLISHSIGIQRTQSLKLFLGAEKRWGVWVCVFPRITVPPRIE
jgi:hypothetical protein